MFSGYQPDAFSRSYLATFLMAGILCIYKFEEGSEIAYHIIVMLLGCPGKENESDKFGIEYLNSLSKVYSVI